MLVNTMSKQIVMEVPDWVDEREIQKEIRKIVALKSIEKIGSEISEREIDELAEEIKEDIWKDLKKWLNSS